MRSCRTTAGPPLCLPCSVPNKPQDLSHSSHSALQTLPHLAAHLLDPIYLTLVYHPFMLLWVQTHLGGVQPSMRAELC